MANKDIIVTMTSWKKRLVNVGPVVYSILKNTVQPTKIICNLSTDELPLKEAELPKDLLLLQKTTCFEVNWVKRNTYTFKKFIPTLQRFYPNDYYMFTIDDDELYQPTYIETCINDFQQHQAVVIAKRNPASTGVWGGMFCCHSSIFKPDYWNNITEELLGERMNDPYTNAYLTFYGYKIFNVLEKLTDKYNEIFPNRGNTGVYTTDKIDRVNKIVANIFASKFTC